MVPTSEEAPFIVLSIGLSSQELEFPIGTEFF